MLYNDCILQAKWVLGTTSGSDYGTIVTTNLHTVGGLAQMTHARKVAIMKMVTGLSGGATTQASVMAAFETAFAHLKAKGASSGCDKVILFASAGTGVTESDVALIKKTNNIGARFCNVTIPLAWCPCLPSSKDHADVWIRLGLI